MSEKRIDLDKRLPIAARQHNRALLLKSLYPAHQLSRADFAKASGLTRATVSDIVAELLEDGLIREIGSSESSGPGRKGTLLHLAADSRNVIVLDLSMPYLFRGAIMELDGRIIFRDELMFSNKDASNLALLDELCSRLICQAKAPILGIGAACPGIVTREGLVRTSMNLGWRDVDLKKHLHKATGLPATINNDANDEVFAEYQFGQGSPDMLLIQLTQGLGAGMLVGGEINGWVRSVGEIGHIIVDKKGPICMCGKRGCLDAMINVPHLISRISADPEHRMDILESSGSMLGDAISMLVGMLGFSRVVILGDSSVVNQVFIQSVQQELNDNIAADFRSPVTVTRSMIGEDLALLGACTSVIRDQLHFTPDASSASV